ncbi:MAG TPA: type II toxin-antitoxin system RelE/ParE family toxin [Burkholderiaceae bacterium]
MHSIEYSREANKVLAKMPRDVRALVEKKIEVVAADPYGAQVNAKRLQGRPEFRIRVGDWRVIYRLLDDRLVLLVIKIGVRGQVYE